MRALVLSAPRLVLRAPEEADLEDALNSLEHEIKQKYVAEGDARHPDLKAKILAASAAINEATRL